jgi:ATP-binding cassette subfamily C protein CydD
VSFELNADEALLLKGPSGTGKTTLLDTLAGLRTQVSGKIIVNGEVTDVFRQQSWYRQVGYMPQTAELLFGSLRENLTLGSQYADEVLFEALRAANAESLVRSLPGQLDYVISDGGGRLSGGQAQRIALARVFLHQPSLLLLDEPTANLDEQTAQEFMQRLELYRRRGGMVIMSSHLHHKSDFFDQIVDLEAPASASQSESESQAQTESTRETHSL